MWYKICRKEILKQNKIHCDLCGITHVFDSCYQTVSNFYTHFYSFQVLHTHIDISTREMWNSEKLKNFFVIFYFRSIEENVDFEQFWKVLNWGKKFFENNDLPGLNTDQTNAHSRE